MKKQYWYVHRGFDEEDSRRSKNETPPWLHSKMDQINSLRKKKEPKKSITIQSFFNLKNQTEIEN